MTRAGAQDCAIRRQPRARARRRRARAARAQNYFGQNQVQYDKFDWQIIETEHFLHPLLPGGTPRRRSTRRAWRSARTRASRGCWTTSSARRSRSCSSRRAPTSGRTTSPAISAKAPAASPKRSATACCSTSPATTAASSTCSRTRWCTRSSTTSSRAAKPATDSDARAVSAAALVRRRHGRVSVARPELARSPTTWMRDAALYGKLPTIEQMTDEPDKFFPYRYGQSLWTFVGQHWGDEAIGQIMNSVPSVGVERAFRRELGVSLDDLGDEWREDVQTRLLPAVGGMDRPRKFAQPLLTRSSRPAARSSSRRRCRPTASTIAFLSNGSVRARRGVHRPLARRRRDRQAHGATRHAAQFDPDFEELRLLYSQSAFSPDGQTARAHRAAPGQGRSVPLRRGVAASRSSASTCALESVTGPTWSPDGRADRVQRQHRRHHGSLHRQRRRHRASSR